MVTTGFNVLNTDFSRNMAMENIKILLPGFSLNGWLLHPDLLWEKSVVLQMVKSLKNCVCCMCRFTRSGKGIPYCSKICCMYTAKHAMLYQHKVHNGESYVFYMDIRAGGKNYEEFVRRAIEEDGVNYIRGRVARIYEKWQVDCKGSRYFARCFSC